MSALLSLLAACPGVDPGVPDAPRRDPPDAGLLRPSASLSPDVPRCGDLGPQRRPTPIDPAAPVRARLELVGADALALPLRSTDLHTIVTGTVAETTVVQTFHNPEQRPVDARYIYPLQPDADVDRLDIRVGPRTLHHPVRRRLAREPAPADRLTRDIAGIPAGAVVEVRLHYVEPLRPRAGRFSLRLPTAVDAPPVDGLPTTRTCGPLDLHLELATGAPPTDLRSESHALLYDPAAPGPVKLALARDLRPDRDFELSWRLAADVPQAHLLSQRTAEGETHLALVLHPPQDLAPAAARPRELVLVFDASPRIPDPDRALARAAVHGLLADLGPADTFQILRLRGDAVTTLAAAPLPARDVPRGLAFLDAAEDPGTTVLAALTAALSRPADPARLRTLVLLGDGRLAGESALFATFARLRGDARVFAFGVGPDVHRSLLAGLADLGRGAAVFADPGDPAALSRLRERLGRPVLTDIQLDWGELPVEDVTPAELPDLHLGGLVVVHARLRSRDRGARPPRISGTLGAGPFSVTVRPEDRTGPGRTGLAVAWARRRIDEVFAAPRADAARGPDPGGVRRVVDLGLRHSLTTPYTALVADDERPARRP